MLLRRRAAPVARQAATPVRPEIQALRALAVALVVVYHLWPVRLPGGYVGVDVFFVISGFLITQHIVRDLDAGTFTLARFYLRRARRLLPAAGVVLLSVSVATALLLPPSWWMDTAWQVAASLGYGQNWLLISVDVGYLIPTRPPGPVRHFWSLSVEEQFYLLWPVMLLVVARLAAAVPAARRRQILFASMFVLAAGSFGFGLWLTARNPDDAYYSSAARAWEFAVGGLLGLLPRWSGRPRARAGLAGLGLAAVGAAGLGATGSAAFPGWAAALPVAGALAVIGAGTSPSRLYPSAVVRSRPVQLAGDLSYSIYLWHWPLIVFWPFLPGAGPLGLPGRLAVLVLSVALAGLTKRLVEDRFRARRSGPPGPGSQSSRPRWRPPRCSCRPGSGSAW
jgi:peptidoglycan/LPS O-acetylase OafA/YrhL